jgi:hypothetical protein
MTGGVAQRVQQTAWGRAEGAEIAMKQIDDRNILAGSILIVWLGCYQ